LIETETGNHLWAEKYDGALEDVFDLQDRITEGVAGAIEPSLRQAEVERARRKRPENLDAYDLYLRALPHAWAWAPEEQEKSVELLEAALKIDPHYVAAHGLLAWSYSTFVVLDPSDSRRDKSVQHARAVLGPNTDDPLALAFASFALALFERDYDAALSAVDRALSFTPNSPTVLAFSATSNAFAGHFDTAIEQAQASLRLSPFDPMRFTAEVSVGYGCFFTGRYHDAAEAAYWAIPRRSGSCPAMHSHQSSIPARLSSCRGKPHTRWSGTGRTTGGGAFASLQAGFPCWRIHSGRPVLV
jgi:tetratricopeptide (TPR) repeat protein